MRQPTEQQLCDPKWWDKIGAPKDATHYGPPAPGFDAIWVKEYDAKHWFQWVHAGGSWFFCNRTDRPLIQRPIHTQWQGPQDGLPPVGTECLATWLEPPDGGGRLPEPVLIKGYHGGKKTQVWFARGNGEDMVHLADNCLFEPLKTEAERVRGNLVDELAQVMVDYYDWPDGIAQYRNLAFYIHDAGYRKPIDRAEAYDRAIKSVGVTTANEKAVSLILDALGYKD